MRVNEETAAALGLALLTGIRPNQRLEVGGAVTWAKNRITVEQSGQALRIQGNGLPNHQTGVFPADSTTSPEALRYHRNPNRIQQVQLSYQISAEPKLAEKPGCLNMGPIDADMRDAVTFEIFDRCQGNPKGRGQYHRLPLQRGGRAALATGQLCAGWAWNLRPAGRGRQADDQC